MLLEVDKCVAVQHALPELHDTTPLALAGPGPTASITEAVWTVAFL
jgi:hypothetical protein